MSSRLGRQIRLYLDADDHPAVEAFLRDTLDAVLVASRWPSATPMEVDSSAGEGQLTFICPRALLGTVCPRHVAAQGYWIADPVTEPFIEWSASPLANGMMHPGRFYYIPREAKFGEKDEEFLRAADRLFRWLRKATPWVATEWGRERLGPVAGARYARGEFGLRRNPPGSRI